MKKNKVTLNNQNFNTLYFSFNFNTKYYSLSFRIYFTKQGV